MSFVRLTLTDAEKADLELVASIRKLSLATWIKQLALLEGEKILTQYDRPMTSMAGGVSNLPKPKSIKPAKLTKEEKHKEFVETAIQRMSTELPPLADGTPRMRRVMETAEEVTIQGYDRNNKPIVGKSDAWQAEDRTAHELYLAAWRHILENDLDPMKYTADTGNPYKKYVRDHHRKEYGDRIAEHEAKQARVQAADKQEILDADGKPFSLDGWNE